MNLRDNVHRTVLPIPDQPRTGLVTYDARDPDTKYPPITPLRPPKDAPNVLIVLLDDVGFGASSAFGGPCNTPTAELLASQGLKYNRFHTTALCSPTRQAMLTGRNHHTVGMGGITEIATSAPGYNSILPNTCSPIARTLKLNGYATAQFGKCHEVPVWETSPAGPFDAWPTGGGGFEYFYGFIGGETNQWYPSLYEGTTPIEVKKTPEEGYHFMEDMTDKAINWIGQEKALIPDKPFFIYFAPGATHAPHHVPKEWADKYKGKFDQGWDKLREEIFARQKALGVIPQDCKLTARHKEIPAWDEMPASLKPVLTRQMEIYAGFFEYTDHHVGRLVDAMKKLDLLDNTLIFYIIGDNGASAEGTLQGTYNEILPLMARPHWRRPNFCWSGSISWAAPSRTTTMPSAGPTHLTRHTSGLSRSPRIGAARAMAPSSTGRKPSRQKEKSAASSITSSISRQPFFRLLACPGRSSSTEFSSTPSKVSAWRTPSTTLKLPINTRHSTSKWPAIVASTTRAGLL